MRSRFLNELTSPEIDEYLSQGGNIAFLPVGSVEMHGPHMPIGTDALMAKAFALKLAEGANGIVLPEVSYTWAGATDGFSGTVSIEPELVQKTVEAIAVKVLKMGFKRLVLVNGHGPNNQVLFLTVRRFYENYQPILFVDLGRPLSEKARNNTPDEASMLLAALNILGLSELYPEKDIIYDDPAPLQNESFRRLSRAGIVGYNYQDPRQHVSPNLQTSAKAGLDYIDMQVESLLPLMDDLSKYIDESKEQKNRGWWKNQQGN
jgi:creatinine amidohydrolase